MSANYCKHPQKNFCVPSARTVRHFVLVPQPHTHYVRARQQLASSPTASLRSTLCTTPPRTASLRGPSSGTPGSLTTLRGLTHQQCNTASLGGTPSTPQSFTSRLVVKPVADPTPLFCQHIPHKNTHALLQTSFASACGLHHRHVGSQIINNWGSALSPPEGYIYYLVCTVSLFWYFVRQDVVCRVGVSMCEQPELARGGSERVWRGLDGCLLPPTLSTF